MKNFMVIAVLGLCIPISGCITVPDTSAAMSSDRLSAVLSPIKATQTDRADTPAPGSEFSAFLSHALARNSEIRAFRKAQAVAESGVDRAVSQTRPQVDGSVSGGAYRNDISSGTNKAAVAISLQVSQLLYDGGRVAGSIGVSQLEVALAQSALTGASNRISSEAAVAWAGLWQAQAEVAAAAALQDEVRPHVAQLERMSQAGMIDRSVSDQVASRLVELDMMAEEAVSTLSLAQIQYAEYFGDAEFGGTLPELSAAAAGQLDLDINLTSVPSVRAGALRVLLAEERAAIAKAAYKPRVSLQLGASSPMNPDNTASAQVGFNVTYQFSDGGARDADSAGAEDNVHQAKSSLDDVRADASNFAASLRERTAYLSKSVKLTIKRLAALDQQLAVAESQIQTGQADMSKVFEMKVKRYEMESAMRRRQADAVRTRFELAAALGLFSKS